MCLFVSKPFTLCFLYYYNFLIHLTKLTFNFSFHTFNIKAIKKKNAPILLAFFFSILFNSLNSRDYEWIMEFNFSTIMN